jgi:hypothetical protein
MKERNIMRIIKKNKVNILIIGLIMLTVLLCFNTQVQAAPKVILDGTTLDFDVNPIIENGRTLVPLRAIFEAMGANVSWDQYTQTAIAVKGSTTVVLKIGSLEPTINGQINRLDVPAKIIDGRTLAPLRFIGEAFGGTVGWDQGSQTITILSKIATRVSSPTTPTIDTQTPSTTAGQYIGNKNSKVFHRTTCKSLPYPKNQVYFSSRDEAISQGFTPCGNCKP